MAIPIDSLNKNFIVVTPATTVAEVCNKAKLIGNNWIYVVLQSEAGNYAILRIGEIIKLLQNLPEPHLKLHDTLVETLDLSPYSFLTSLDQQSIGRDEAQRLVNAARGKRLVVTSEDQVIGVLALEARSAAVKPDFEWLDQLLPQPEHSPPIACSATEIEHDPEPIEPVLSSSPSSSPDGGSFIPDLDALGGGGGVLSNSEDTSEARWINAEILDHPSTAPFEVGQIYTLAFDVDTEQRSSSLVSTAFTYSFVANEEMAELTVQLSSSDFTIHTEPQKLKVPRTGKSRGRARFDIEPTHYGRGVVSAVFLKDGNFIQLLTLELNVGKTPEIKSESMSRPLEAAFDVQPRDLGLVITNTGTGFKLILTGPVYAEASLPLTLPELDQLIGEVRSALKQVVNLEEGPNRKRAYQLGIDISEQSSRLALKHLAETGFLLFQRMFYGDAADAQTRLLGDKLIEMAEKQRLKIQIVSQQFLLPWGMMYLAREFDPNNIDPECFLGFRHIIEHIPLQPSMQVVDSVIQSQPKLAVSINVNTDIDQQMGLPLIADQLDYWKKISDDGAALVTIRKSGQEIEQALGDSSAVEQILYFYCHAVSRGLAEGGPEASSLQFAGRTLSLRDLKLRAPTKKPLPGLPLVFINACESAELSPMFYGGFVPYFMAKGARGVIGTECETPALFAREWARRFFEEFLGGESLGQVFLNLRREFYFQHNNVMGLLYAVYCDGDTRVVPAVALSK